MFAFEVRDSDLLGRIGKLKAGGKTIETPCLLPVVHPTNQVIPSKELWSMGFRGLMTNSYILRSRFKGRFPANDIHGILDFDGLVMTDSGGYQVLEYGDLDVSYSDMASFQGSIGSDIAVTLDRPTGYPVSRKYAMETVDYSLENAEKTLREYGEGPPVWVGPVQGGLYLDLVRMSARALVDAGFDVLALGSPVQVMVNYMFADLVRMIVAARSQMQYSVPLHLFGAGHPLTMALSVALGCDTFDSASYILFARKGRYMTKDGVSNIETMEYLPCSCPICSGTTVRTMLELDPMDRTRQLSVHNLYILRTELDSTKEAIAEGRLWDLVEAKSMLHPRLREAFLELVRHSEMLVEGTAAIKDRGLFLRSGEDLARPEVISARERLGRARRRDSKSAVVFGSESVTALGAGRHDEYRSHPALGLYPVELDFVYPFGQTVSVRGLVGPEARRSVAGQLKAMGYSASKARRPRKRKILVRSRRSRRGVSPSPRSSSARPRSPRRP